jgi:phenylacetate-coenzyme A ligase PaaK-like adenylate-forming protein
MDRYFVLASGGSSGVRGLFAWDRDAAVEFFCAVLRSGLRQVAAMMGWPPARPLPIVLAAAPTGMHATRALMTLAEGAVAMPVFAPATLPFDEVVERVNAAQPMLIAGYTSTVARLADARAAGSLTATPQMVVVTSEQLTPELSDRIARGFGAPPANNFASTEGLIGAAPPGSDVFDFASDLAIVEFVDAEDRPVSVGEPADHVLVTNLANVTQPLIRYRLDDRMVEAEPSPLHGHQRARLDGRNDAYMDLGGVQIHPLSLRSALLKHPEIIEYQVFHGAGGLRVDIVPGGPVDSTRLEREIAAVLVAAGANGIEVTIRPVDAVRRDPGTGKARRFIAS